MPPPTVRHGLNIDISIPSELTAGVFPIIMAVFKKGTGQSNPLPMSGLP